MMDLREIIKWFIPCFHILLKCLRSRHTRWTFVCLFLLVNCGSGLAAPRADGTIAQTKNEGSFSERYVNVHQSDIISNGVETAGARELSEGRTFGRPFKKMVAGLLPIIFQLGAASTWAVLAALVGVKTLAVALLILKLLLLAGALKLGALFGQKHQSHGWEPPHHHSWEPPHHGWEPPHPSKEIHLHIHNGQGQPIEHAPYSGWSRNGSPAVSSTSTLDSKNINIVYEPYSDGPQTISTPYGNYVKVQSTLPSPIIVK